MRARSLPLVLLLVCLVVLPGQPVEGMLKKGGDKWKLFKSFLKQTGLLNDCSDVAPKISKELAPFGMTMKTRLAIWDSFKSVDCSTVFLGTRGVKLDGTDNYGVKADENNVMAFESFMQSFFKEPPNAHLIIPFLKTVDQIYFDFNELTDCNQLTTEPVKAFRTMVKKARKYKQTKGVYGFSNMEFIYIFAMKDINPNLHVFCQGTPTGLIVRPKELKFNLNGLFPGWLDQLKTDSGKDWPLIESYIDERYLKSKKSKVEIVELDPEGKEIPLAIKNEDQTNDKIDEKKPKDKQLPEVVKKDSE